MPLAPEPVTPAREQEAGTAEPAPAAPRRDCTLCGLPVRGRTDGFCCPGCRHVFEILREMLGSAEPGAMRDHEFFQRMQASGIVPRADAPPRASGAAPLEIPPGEAVERRSLRVEGMWCPSCAWVIEHVLRGAPGILQADASFSSDRVLVSYLTRLTGPAEIARRIQELGYRVLEPASGQEERRNLDRQLLRLGISIFLTVNVMMLSFGVYQGFFTRVSESSVRLVGAPAFAMSTLVLFYGGAPILRRAFQAGRAGAFVMETLISLGALAAYGMSLANLLRGSLHLYFDTASMLVTMVLLGLHLESRLRRRSAERIEEIYELLPGKARLVTAVGDRYASSRAVQPGDLVRVLEGEQVPVDGYVVEGRGLVDDSRLTGESTPRSRKAGDPVLAAGLLCCGELTVSTTAAGEDSAVGAMIRLMEGALLSRNPAERLSDRLMALFGPAVLLVAAATGATLALLGRPIDEALVRSITVLAIACPCALGIAIPLAKVAAVGRAWLAGIVVVNADALEKACRITALVLDKTGTATHGKYQVLGLDTRAGEDSSMDSTLAVVPELGQDTRAGEDRELVALAAAVEAGSAHPAAGAIRDYAALLQVTPPKATAISQEPGLGARGWVNGTRVLVGGLALLGLEGVPMDPAWVERADRSSSLGATPVFVARDGKVRGLFSLGDSPREDMAPALEALRGRGVEVILVSGDTPGATAHMARRLGLARFAGGLLPGDKVETVTALQRQGHRVGMVGDGANDAAALAVADVGLATGDALTAAKHASDIVLLSFSGARLLQALDLSRETSKTIGGNLALSLAYNTLALPLAVSGWVNPILAVALMVASSLTVVMNSARLARAGEKR